MPYTYRKQERLRKNSEFVAAMKGKRLSVDGLSLFYAPNGLSDYRVGISVGKKIANAVKRNRLKRRLRACIGKALGSSAAGYDLVFVARQDISGLDHGQMMKVVEKALRRSTFRNTHLEGVKS